MAYIEFLTDKIGRCDHCELRDSPLYLYSDHKKMTTEVRCEDCIPRCECGSMNVEDGTDYCSQCNEVIELEEKA